MTQLEALARELIAATEKARMLGRDANWGRRPADGVWSAAECVAHLSQSSDTMLPPLEEAVRSAPQAAPPYHLNWKERLLIWFLEPPYRLKAKTSGGFAPRPAGPENVLNDFGQRQHRLELLLAAAEGKALDRVRITSPFNARMSYSAWAGLVLLLAHQRRHLWQAERTLSRFRV